MNIYLISLFSLTCHGDNLISKSKSFFFRRNKNIKSSVPQANTSTNLNTADKKDTITSTIQGAATGVTVQAIDHNKNELILALQKIAHLLQTPQNPQPKAIMTELKELYAKWKSNKLQWTLYAYDKVTTSVPFMIMFLVGYIYTVFSTGVRLATQPTHTRITHSVTADKAGFHPEIERVAMKAAKQLERERYTWADRFMGKMQPMENKAVKCIALFGPPGTGKTFFASVLANTIAQKMPGAKLYSFRQPYNFIIDAMDAITSQSENSTRTTRIRKQISKFADFARANATSASPIILFFDEIDNLLESCDRMEPTKEDMSLLNNYKPDHPNSTVTLNQIKEYYQRYATIEANKLSQSDNEILQELATLLDGPTSNANILIVFTSNNPHMWMTNVIGSRCTRVHVDFISQEQKRAALTRYSLVEKMHADAIDKIMNTKDLTYREFNRMMNDAIDNYN